MAETLYSVQTKNLKDKSREASKLNLVYTQRGNFNNKICRAAGVLSLRPSEGHRFNRPVPSPTSHIPPPNNSHRRPLPSCFAPVERVCKTAALHHFSVGKGKFNQQVTKTQQLAGLNKGLRAFIYSRGLRWKCLRSRR